MEKFNRAFESSLTADKGDLVGRVFKYDQTDYADGMDETIPSNCDVQIADNCMALLSHKKELMVGRHKQNLSFEKRSDGLWFRIKKVGTQAFKEASELVANKIIGGVSPGFRAHPIYEKNKRTFSKMIIDEISLVGNPAYSQSFVTKREKTEKGPLPPEVYL